MWPIYHSSVITEHGIFESLNGSLACNILLKVSDLQYFPEGTM